MRINDLMLGNLALVEGDHIVLAAEVGYSMLDLYGRGRYGISLGDINQFANKVNEFNEPGSLYPRAPISGVPSKYFRELAGAQDPSVFTEFQQHLRETLETIAGLPVQTPIKTVVPGFRVSPAPVPERYAQAARAAAQDFAGTHAFSNAFAEIIIALG